MTDTTPGAEAPPTAPSEEAIRDLVYSFYDAVRADPLIGPVFDANIAPDAWPAHLDKMCSFWSSVLLKTKRYDGRPLPPHLTLGPVTDAHFARWLTLFRPVARRVLDHENALKAIAHAERMALSFRMGIAVHRGEDSTRIAPLPEEA